MFYQTVKKFIIYTDGGSRGNPGPSAIGVAIYNEKEQELKKYGEYLGDNLTNNEAEYQAVIFALKKFKALFGKKLAEHTEIEIRCDSEFLVLQVNGEYKVLNEKIQKLFLELWNLRLDFKKIKFKYISRDKNKEADRLVNEALDNTRKSQTLI
ncbi:ribonuclease HI family protein [Patescibacteria group bacterium]|nr:ribonuclease HI family protein [Patescibacteria group bacterium]MBU4274618.1 ribonuclease HI family protein [Patescibacteria group bacterium]MBU4367664.1 ribonuclease HI family protein [Patescibacteria group bacterium]MBU4461886.1 ribonuclease HI family protein [Patescibacteria group bacterium]